MLHRRGASTTPDLKEDYSKNKADENTLIDWDQLHPWQRDNEYIRTHYRKASYSINASLWTTLKIHNETGETSLDMPDIKD